MSQSTISLAKTTRPELSGSVLRERLLARIDEGAKGSAVWISGPPGAGKTTLIASYLESREVAHIWYQIDHVDSDVATFFLYLGQSVLKAGAKGGKPLPLMAPEYAAKPEVFARRYFRELYSRLQGPFVIVLDNYHDVAFPSAMHDVIRFGLEEVPKRGCVIVTSRTDPPPAMARLRANQGLQIIDWDALRLTREEMQQMVEARGQPLPDDDLEALYQKTEGWAAGVVLMLQHQKTRGEIASVPSASTPQVIFDYLAGEIFEKFESATQDFLLGVSFLPRMTTSMAQAFTGQSAAPQMLLNLTRNDYFVSETRTSDGEEYQFHPLFREFLLSRATEHFSPPAFRELRLKAAGLLREVGQIDSAVDLLNQEDAWDEVADIITEHAGDMLQHGRAETLVEWLDSVPEQTLAANPWTLYWSGAARFHTAPRESRRDYEQAFHRFGSVDPPHAKGRVLSCCGVIDTITYELDDLSLLDRWIVILDKLLKDDPRALSKNIEARVTCSMFMAMVLRKPDHPDIGDWAERAASVSEASSDATLRSAIEPFLALSLMWTGQYAKAYAAIERTKTLARETDLPPLALATLKVMESMYYMLLGDADQCMQAVEKGLALHDTHGVRVWGNQLLANAVGGQLGAGNLEQAAAWLRRMESPTNGTRRLDMCLFHYFSAWHHLLEEDAIGAYHQQKKALNLALEVGIPFVELLCRLGLGQVLYECGDDRKGQVQLRKVHALARDINNHLLEFMTLLVYAYLAIKRGKRRSGLNSLRYAMALGREYDYKHFLWWQPKMVTELCMTALAEGIEEEFVRSLIRSRALYPSAPPYDQPGWPWRFRVCTLGTFKLMIDNKPQTFSGKAPVRSLELLKVLIALGGKEVRAEQLAEAMWPHVDGDYAHRSFTTTLHRLRKLLGADEVVLLHDGRVSLNTKYVWTDIWALQHVFSRVDESFRGPVNGLDTETVKALADALLTTYTGQFLEDESEQPCYIAVREHLRGKFLRYVGKLARYWEDADEWERALEYYERGLESDNLSEGFYRHLMLCNQALGRNAEALEVYRRCRATLSAALRIAPSAETTGIYERIAREEHEDD